VCGDKDTERDDNPPSVDLKEENIHVWAAHAATGGDHHHGTTPVARSGGGRAPGRPIAERSTSVQRRRGHGRTVGRRFIFHLSAGQRPKRCSPTNLVTFRVVPLLGMKFPEWGTLRRSALRVTKGGSQAPSGDCGCHDGLTTAWVGVVVDVFHGGRMTRYFLICGFGGLWDLSRRSKRALPSAEIDMGDLPKGALGGCLGGA